MRTPNCQGCGKPLIKPRPNQRYHDEKCQYVAYRQRKKKRPFVSSSVFAPLVLLAGVDTLYVNVYYADPKRYTRAMLPLRDETKALLDGYQQRAKAARKLAETPWSILDQSLYSRPHGSKELWGWILRNEYVNVQIGTGEYRGLNAPGPWCG